MEFENLDIPEVKLLHPRRFGDERGFFSETFRDTWFSDAGLPVTFRQDNHAFSSAKGTLRGLHFQTGKSVQAKLVRCTRGAILDVAVDIRKGSPTFGQYVAAELTAENGTIIFVPHGFAHAYCTLTEDCEVLYKVDNFYDREREGAVIWSDPSVGVVWPFGAEGLQLSEKDKVAPTLDDLPDHFLYDTSLPFNVKCLDLA